MATIRLTWNETPGAVEYKLYHNTMPGLSTRFSPLLTTTAFLTYDHITQTSGNHYYIVVAVGPNDEIGPPSVELIINTAGVGNPYGRGFYGRILWGSFAVLTSIAVTPINPSIASTGTQQMTATGTYDNGQTVDLTSDVIWTSGTPSIATISDGGLITGVLAGTSLITATLGAISGNTTATITTAGWSVFYDFANQPSTPPSGYSHTPALGGGLAVYSGIAKVGSTVVASNAIQAWFTGAGDGNGKYPFITTTDNGSSFQVTSWPVGVDNTMALDGNTVPDFGDLGYSINIFATNDKFLVGCEKNNTTNYVYSTDGVTWHTDVKIGTGNKAFSCIHSANDGTIFAVSDSPTSSTVVFKSTDDGASWSSISAPSLTSNTWIAVVYAVSATEVWIAGFRNGAASSSPIVFRGDGAGSWTDKSQTLNTAIGAAAPTHSTNHLGITGIYASGTNDVYLIDSCYDRNQLYHTTDQGTSWTITDVGAGTAIYFNGIGGSSSSNIYLAGESGNVYHYNGSAWSKETLPVSPGYIAGDNYYAVWMDNTTAYVCGRSILKR